MPIWFEFEFLVALIVLSLLGAAAWQDYLSREVSDLPWVILFLFWIPLTGVRIVLYFNDPSLLLAGFSSTVIGILIAISLGMLRLWGGADVLAMIAISLALPWPVTSLPIQSQGASTFLSFFPLAVTVFFNAAILQIPIPLLIFMRNVKKFLQSPNSFLEPRNASPLKKTFASFLGSPKTAPEIIKMPPWFYSFMERFHYTNTVNWEPFLLRPSFVRHLSEPLLRWKKYRHKLTSMHLVGPSTFRKSSPWFLPIFGRIRSDLAVSAQLGSEEEDLMHQRQVLDMTMRDFQVQRLWVQYTVPMLVPLTIGLALGVFVGNVIFLALLGA
ncbi:MAG TPA: A24 family peptidase [Candidatus Hodarchaeales archaeon]|nr:A24 family peptidase [Candidatus Hodarchaeales archaeon]